MNLTFKNRKESKETTGFTSQFITYGISLLKISGYELKESSTGKFQVKFIMETKPVGDDFIGADLPNDTKAEGLIGRVNLGIFFSLDDDFKINALMNNLMFMAEKAGILEEVKGIEASSLDDLLSKYVKKMRNKYMYFIIKGSEYEKDGKKGFGLSFKEGVIGSEGGKKIFQIFCKEEAFAKDTKDTDIVMEDGKIIKLPGINTIGSSIGKKDTLTFTKTYDLQLLEAADKEVDVDKESHKGSEEVDELDQIFKTGAEPTELEDVPY